jgi:DNA mismatch endonuclease, patch repair protein
MAKMRQQAFKNVPAPVRARMARIRKTDTSPELAVRRVAYRLGYRFRLHRKDLPGTPDLVFPSIRKVVLVHGCFWHQHRGCRSATTPRVRQGYWLPKLARNRQRDHDTLVKLRDHGWNTLVIWECEVKNPLALEAKLAKFLSREN